MHVGDGLVVRDFRSQISAVSPSEAVQAARRAMPAPVWHGWVTVYRHRRLRGRTLVGTYAAGGPGDDGWAGVREPRRPLPDPPVLSRAAERPAYPHHHLPA